MKASDIALDSNVSALFKGPPGFSKTISAASFAVDGPTYLAYWDKKKPVELMSYYGRMGEVGKRILANIDYDIYSSDNAGAFLEKLLVLAENCRYFAVINDSITNMTAAAVNWSLSFRSSKNKNKDKILPDWDEYKVETSLVSQCLDICKKLPCNVIWTAHPLPGIKLEGSGSSMRVTKVNPIVSYGSKVAAMIPGNFNEIYQFSKQSNWNSETGKSSIRYIVSPEAVGDDYAKSDLGLKSDFDITDRLFYHVWKEQVENLRKEIQNDLTQPSSINPSANSEIKWRT